ncbi:MAG: hypothetical protein HY240_09445 [Actinobacteria bacterium]|nr:hypothetical protein [Actinomycetota bacterium]
MRRHQLDDDTADRLLSGRIQPDDAPPGYGEVARLIRAVSAPAKAEELAFQEQAIAAAVEVVGSQAAHRPAPRSRRSFVRQKLLRAKVAGLVVAGTIIGTTGLAFAGALPDGAQNTASNALAKIGISVPSGHPASTGQDISGVATTTDSTGVDKGAEISGLASGGVSQAGQHGAPDSTPPVTTPNSGGTGTADTASGGASGAGTGTAGTDSGGDSTAGSANDTTTP